MDSLVAIRAELAEQEASQQQWASDEPRLLERVTPLGEDTGRYDILVDRAVFPLEGAGMTLRPGTGRVLGAVERLSADGLHLEVALDPLTPPPELGDRVLFDGTRMTRGLLTALEHVAQTPLTSAAQAWLGLTPVDTEARVSPIDVTIRSDLNLEQCNALDLVSGRQASWIIGPPGTGKTRTLVAAAIEAASSGELVLITTTTNTALDEVLRRLIPVARERGIGVGRGGEGGDDLPLSGVRTIEPWHLRPRRESPTDLSTTPLESAVSSVSPTGEFSGFSMPEFLPSRNLSVDWDAQMRLAEMNAEIPPSLLDPHERVARLAAAVGDTLTVASLRSSASTLSKESAPASLGSPVSTPTWGKSGRPEDLPIIAATCAWLSLHGVSLLNRACILVDEAGMVTMPHAVLVSSQASRRIAAFGDPQQLPPVTSVQSPELSVQLSQHPFRLADIAPVGQADDRRIVLREQYRMAPAVAHVISTVFYSGALRTATGVEDVPPGMAAVALVDTSALNPVVEQQGRSRTNPIHVDLVARLARLALKATTGSIAVITPFAAQARALRSALPTDTRLRIRTIHQLQGGEADTVIFDVCDGPPRPGVFLNERLHPEVAQLLCVALSRARLQCVVVAHEPVWRQMAGDEDTMLTRLFRALRESGVFLQPSATAPPVWNTEAGLVGDWDTRWSPPWDESSWGA